MIHLTLNNGMQMPALGLGVFKPSANSAPNARFWMVSARAAEWREMASIW